MNESAEYTRLLAQAYSKLADDYSAMTQRVIAAEARVKELEELLEKWALHAARESERADASKARVKELEEDNARGASYVQHLKKQIVARQHGGAE